MFNLRDFIKGGLLGAVGKMANYQIILNSAGWLEKGVLTEDDLAEIQEAIDKQYIEPEMPAIDETPIEVETEITDEIVIEESEQTEIIETESGGENVE